MANEDGKIILGIKINTEQLKAGISNLKTNFGKLKSLFSGIGGIFAAAFSVKMVSDFVSASRKAYRDVAQNEVKLATVMRQRMKATDDQIESILELTSAHQELGVVEGDVMVAGLQQLSTFATQKETIETLLPAMNNLVAQQYGLEASTESARNVANLMGKVLQGQVGALTRVGITFSEAEEQVLKYGNEEERAAMLAQVITNNVGEMNTALAKTDVGRQQQLANTFGDISEELGAAFNQIAILFLPALRMVANVLATIAQFARSAAQSLANMFGGEIAENTEATQSAISASVGGMEDLTDATKEAGKAAKKSLASFDELSIISSGASGGKTEEDSAFGGVAGGAVGSGFDFGIQAKSDEISAELATIMGIASGALAAIGLLLLFFGHPLLGVSFLAAGATGLGISIVTLVESDMTNLIDTELMKILAIAGTALVAIGLILLFCGTWQWGIAFIVAGAGSLGVAIVATENGKVDKEAETMLVNIMTIAGTAMLALGIILILFGVVSPLSIGLIVAGAGSLAGAVAINPDLVLQSVKDFFINNAGLVIGVSLALLALGIILCVCGIVTPISIGLIVAGAAGLVTEIVLNWNYITEKVTQFFQDNAGLIVGVSVALIVLGIILLFTGVGIPLAIGLIVAGGGALAATVALNWNFIVDKVKEVWDKVKQFWNENIAPVFTAKWWADLGKTAINGLIGTIEKGINFIINKINTISWDVPEWVPGIGGQTWGFNFNEIKIPRLARGAVIPPNREFLAVLGDQKSGTNIEAPLQTIVDAFNIALSQNGGNYGNTEVVLEIDGREFGRAVVEQGNKENRRIGTRLVIV